MGASKVVLVTGAAGFIGGWVVETLCLRGSADVRAGIRRWSSAARIARFPVELVLCNVTEKHQVAEAMAGATTVIHCAVGDRNVIVQGTKNLLEGALRAKVERFVHLSTAEVYGSVSGSIDESFPYQYTGSEYADSKIEAEELCWAAYESGLAVTVLRPSIVYGPFSAVWTTGLARRLQSGRWRVLQGDGEGTCNLVFVNDLISGILLAAGHESAVGEAFNITGPELITWNAYFQRFSAALGLPELHEMSPTGSKLRSAIMEPIRTSASRILGAFRDPIMEMYMRYGVIRRAIRGGKRLIETTPTLAELGLYNRRARYLTSKARSMLGYRPVFDVDTGLQLSVRWLEHHGLVDRREAEVSE